jgi:hypothetical protein
VLQFGAAALTLVTAQIVRGALEELGTLAIEEGKCTVKLVGIVLVDALTLASGVTPVSLLDVITAVLVDGDVGPTRGIDFELFNVPGLDVLFVAAALAASVRGGRGVCHEHNVLGTVDIVAAGLPIEHDDALCGRGVSLARDVLHLGREL